MTQPATRLMALLLMCCGALLCAGVHAAPGHARTDAETAYEHGAQARAHHDFAAALNWFGQAAKRGHGPALYALGSMYEWGDGVDTDQGQALAWYRKARPWYRQRAEAGDAEAQYTLASLYSLDDADPAEVAKWYRRAARQGHADAQFNLGALYEQGHGVAPDLNQALRWYEKAAAQGNAAARNNLDVIAQCRTPRRQSTLGGALWDSLCAPPKGD